MNQRKILVVGSLNADLVQKVSRIPAPGETIEGSQLEVLCGGKGSNQAYAAARLGGTVTMAGMTGADEFGAMLRSRLRSAGVDVSRVGTSPQSTGAATILVLPSGENLIVLSPGANADVSPVTALEAVDVFRMGDLLLCQLEIPMATVAAAFVAARQRGMVTILDPAPAKPVPPEIFTSVDVLTPNQSEAAVILGGAADDIRTMAEARDAAPRLLKMGPKSVIVTMGPLGCLVARPGVFVEVAGFPVKAVDTTGAGDTFNGALAVSLSEGADLVEAARFASAASALSVTAPGAMDSMPDRAALERFLQANFAATETR